MLFIDRTLTTKDFIIKPVNYMSGFTYCKYNPDTQSCQTRSRPDSTCPVGMHMLMDSFSDL